MLPKIAVPRDDQRSARLRDSPEISPDGLRGTEGTFSLCTVAYADVLARAGRLDRRLDLAPPSRSLRHSFVPRPGTPSAPAPPAGRAIPDGEAAAAGAATEDGIRVGEAR